MASPTQISVHQLARLIATPACPLIVDVRTHEDFEADARLIPGSIRCAFDNIESLLPLIADRKIVVSCHKGLKLSQGSAAILRHHGAKAESLSGGFLAWQTANMPLIPTSHLPQLQRGEASRWVTRQRPKIDRIACPWLIRRFIDPRAEFLFVAPSQVQLVAQHFDAIPFDVENTFWSHREDFCTFDTLLDEFDLHTDALDRLALIVRGADTNSHHLAPEVAGLLAASLGLSRMYKDDLEQLAAGMTLYDAFFRWARDAVDEGHDWPATAGKVEL